MKHTFTGKLLLGALGVGLLASAALPAAANPPPTLQYRMNREQARISRGVQNGSLTLGEYQRDENHLRSIETQRTGDGSLTSQQRAALRRRLNFENNRIYFTKHNRADQPGM